MKLNDTYLKLVELAEVKRQPLKRGQARKMVLLEEDPSIAMVPLNKNWAVIDREDLCRVCDYNWYFHPALYAVTHINNKSTYMHRLITNCPKDRDVDHINGNKLDNRKSNLRICTSSQNLCNRGVTKSSMSGVKGVHYVPRKKKYHASIGLLGKHFGLGYFSNIEDAKKCYDKYSSVLHGSFSSSKIDLAESLIKDKNRLIDALQLARRCMQNEWDNIPKKGLEDECKLVDSVLNDMTTIL